MSEKFNRKLSDKLGKHGHALHISHGQSHPHVGVNTLDGSKLNLKSSQVVTTHSSEITSFVNAIGSFSNILSAGGNVDIELKNSSTHSNAKKIWLKIQLQNNTGAPVTVIPPAFWLRYVEILNSKGGRLQQLYQQNFYEGNNVYSREEFDYKNQTQMLDEEYKEIDNVLAIGESRTVYIELIDNLITSTGYFVAGLREILTFRLWFHPSNITHISGGALTMTNLQMKIESSYDIDFNYNQQLDRYLKNELHFKYNHPLIQEFTQQLQAVSGQEYEFTLTGFNGLISELKFTIRNANPIKRDMYKYYPCLAYELLNEDNTNMVGGSEIDYDEDVMNYSQLYPNLQRKFVYVHRYSFSQDPLSFRTHGVQLGYHPFSTREILRIRIQAEVNRVITVSSGNTPTAGNYRICYKGYKTPWVAFNETPANVQALLNVLPPFIQNNVVMSGALDDGVTFSYGGIEADEFKDLLYIEGDLQFDQIFDSVETVRYVRGLPATQQYTITVWADQVATLTSQNGMVYARCT